MNRPIRKMSIALAVLFLALFVNLNIVQVVNGSDYRDNPQNRRVLLNEYASPRGQIVVSSKDGTTAAATSVSTPDELKYRRVYANGPVYAPATGFYSFTYGSTAIEDAENGILSGDSSQLFTSKLTNILTGRNPRGGSVLLTINKEAQVAAYKAMRAGNGKYKPGAIVALDPKTGAILAMVSTPSYDPNQLSSHDSSKIAHAYNCYVELSFPNRRAGESDAQFKKRTQDSIDAQLALREHGSDNPSSVYGKHGCGDVPQDPTALYKKDPAAASPMLNRALNQTYPAGSIFKIITSAAALKAGIEPRKSIPAANSYWPLEPQRTSACPTNLAAPCVQNFGGETCQNGKTATLLYAFAKSCNTAFAALAVQHLGAQQLKNQARLFGLDAATQLQVPLNVSGSTIGPESVLSDPAALAQTSFGQRNVRVTPLQAAMLSAAVANDGTLMKPYLVQKELRPNLSVLNTTQPQQLSQVLDPDLDAQLASMMDAVVTSPEGTGHTAQINDLNGVTVAGKTGTADVGETSASSDKPDAWFTGYASVGGQAKIAVAVVMENAGVVGDESAGGKAAGPAAQQVMEAYLRSIGVS